MAAATAVEEHDVVVEVARDWLVDSPTKDNQFLRYVIGELPEPDYLADIDGRREVDPIYRTTGLDREIRSEC